MHIRKRLFFLLAATTVIAAGIVFTAYQSSFLQHDLVRDKMMYSIPDMNPDQKASYSKDWKKFRTVSELTIMEHQLRIADLKERMEIKGEISDALYIKRIVYLEHQIIYMTDRLENFERGPGNWELFRNDFNNEMNSIEIILKNLIADNINRE